MAKAKKVKQISFGTKDRAGLLAEVTAAIAKARVNITAICAYGMDKKAYFMLNTSSNAKAKKALSRLGAKIDEDNVVAVEMPNRTGALKQVAKQIGDAGINIYYMYGTAVAGKTAICIFKTANDAKAIKVINK